jgi:hypothetical protein
MKLDLNLSGEEKNTLFQAIRQFAYFLIIFGFIFFIHFLAHRYHEQTFAENNIVENIQLGLLLSATFCFAVQAAYNEEYAALLWLLASFCGLASFRELDSFIEHYMDCLSWKLGFIFPIVAFAHCVMTPTFRAELNKFLQSPAFHMMCCALIIIIPIAQCIGHGPFVRAVLNRQDITAIKELFEECSETMGYMLLLLSSVECAFYLKKK